MNQLSMDFSRRECDRGMSLAELGAENAVEGWSSVALEFIRLYAMRNKGQFTAEDVIEAIPAGNILLDVNHKAFGPVFKRAANLGIIRKVGYGVCRKRHLSPTVLWMAV